MWTAEKLIAFEKDIAQCYDNKQIRAPIHLDGGNEEDLIKIFGQVDKEHDWVCGSWRMHYRCLLKGVPPDQLKADIIAGRSITLCYPEYRVISSAIVGGILPIALGLAWSINRAAGFERVWCFLGDMTAHGGMFHECRKYAVRNRLPIMFIVENNGKSVCTDTEQAWGVLDEERLEGLTWEYEYKLPWPHAGAGTRVQF